MAKTKESEPQQAQASDGKVTKAVKASTIGAVGFGKYKPIPHFRSGCTKC